MSFRWGGTFKGGGNHFCLKITIFTLASNHFWEENEKLVGMSVMSVLLEVLPLGYLNQLTPILFRSPVYIFKYYWHVFVRMYVSGGAGVHCADPLTRSLLQLASISTTSKILLFTSDIYKSFAMFCNFFFGIK